jgi:hypothetical protein
VAGAGNFSLRFILKQSCSNSPLDAASGNSYIINPHSNNAVSASASAAGRGGFSFQGKKPHPLELVTVISFQGKKPHAAFHVRAIAEVIESNFPLISLLGAALRRSRFA